MVGATGNNQTAKGASTRNFVYNASTGNLGIGTTNPIGQLQVSTGPVIIGAAISTGTASQNLQLTGSAYIAGDSNSVGLGIGITNNVTYPVDVRLSGGAAVAMLRLSPSTGTRSAGIIYSNTGSSNMWTGLLNSAGAGQGISGLTAYSGVVGLNAGTTPLLLVTNALERVRVFDTGEVGIGTTVLTGTASQNLQVSGGAYVSGSVGIGTTNPGSKLTVNGAIQIQQDSGSNNRFILRGQPSSSYRWNIDNYGSANDFRIFREDDATAANGVSVVSISTIGTLSATKFSGDGSLLTNLPSASSQWVTTSVGIHTLSNVGIGTTNPTSKLTVSGDALIAGIVTANSFRARGGAPGALGVNNNGYGFFGSGDNDSGMYSSADGQIEFYSNSVEIARIASSGNIGIGTINPTSKLHVVGDATISGLTTTNNLYVSGVSTFTNGPVFIGSGTSTGTASQRLQVTGGAYVSGNLGVGATAPAFAADIAGDARVTSTNKMRFGGTAGTTNFYIQYNSTANSLDFVAG
jgi:hypothetical protein